MTEAGSRHRPRIVVGVDGSDGAQHALQWAARQARYGGATLEAVIAWQYPAFFGWAPVGVDSADFDTIAEKTLDDALTKVFGPERPGWLQARVVEGYPAEGPGRGVRGGGPAGRRAAAGTPGSPTRCSARSAPTACTMRTGRSPSSGRRAGLITDPPRHTDPSLLLRDGTPIRWRLRGMADRPGVPQRPADWSSPAPLDVVFFRYGVVLRE